MHTKMEAELAYKQQLLREQEELAKKLREKELSLDNATGM
jgi:hypothetical protein